MLLKYPLIVWMKRRDWVTQVVSDFMPSHRCAQLRRLQTQVSVKQKIHMSAHKDGFHMYNTI